MRNTSASRISRLLALPLAAGLALLASAPQAGASEHAFNPYQLGDNSRGNAQDDRLITRAQAREDLDTLARAMDENSAYVWSSTFDHRHALQQIAAALPEQVSVNGLSTQLNRFVRLFGDDHAQVLDWEKHIPQAGIAARIGKADARYFLYSLATPGLLDPKHPWLRSIDGVSIDEWMRVAGDIGQGPLSSPAARFSRAQRIFPYIEHLRAEMGLATGGPVQLEMVSEDGTRAVMLRLPLQASPGEIDKPFNLPDTSRMLANNVGYLRVPAHRGPASEQLIAELPRLMEQFRSTHALIIDARQSGGGKRAVLNALFPYFMAPDAAPYVFNAVKLRKSQVKPGQDPATLFDDEDKRFLYVEDRGLVPADARAWREFAHNFIPTWMPPEDRFTNWYFMALRPRADKPRYDKPVYLLVDWGVGSAGDIFASAFKSWPGITLVGTPTMGRSGQGRPYRLAHSGLEVNLSTMASFQKTGERYDTVGIHPDIRLEPVPSDWYGKTDSVLERVQAMIAAPLGRPAPAAKSGQRR